MRPVMLLAVAALLSVGDARGAERHEPASDAAFAGTWWGTLTIEQQGQCRINGAPRSVSRLRFVIQTAADGSFKLGAVPIGDRSTPKPQWSGRFEADGIAKLDGTGHREGCAPYALAFAGAAREREDGQELTFSAHDPGCPGKPAAESCTFGHFYRLSRRADPGPVPAPGR